MASIGRLNLLLSANPAQFNRDLATALRGLEGFGGSLARGGVALGQRLGRDLFGSLQQVAGGGRVLDTLFQAGARGLQDLLAKIPYVGGALAAEVGVGVAAFTTLKQVVMEGIDNIVGLYRQSQRLGVSLESLQAIRLLPGVEPEKMERGMLHLARVLGDLQAGSQEEAKALRLLGIDAQKFQGLNLDQALALAADEMAGLQNSTDKTYLAVKLFGRDGAALVPMLSRGAAGIEEAKKKLQDLGIAFTEADAKAALAAKKSLGQIDKAVEGAKGQFAVGFVQGLEEVGKAFGSLGVNVRDFRTAGLAAAWTLGGFLAVLMELGNAAQAVWLGAVGAFESALAKAADGIARLADLGSDLPGVGDKLAGIRDRARELGGALGSIGDKDLAQSKAGFGKVGDWWKNLQRGMEERLKQMAEDDRKAAEPPGPSEDSLLALGRLRDQALQIQKDMMSPAEKFQARLEELNNLMAKGAFDGAGGMETYARAVRAAGDELDRLMDKQQGPGALLEGSAAAYSALYKFERGPTTSAQDRVKDAIDRAAEQQRQRLERIARAVEEAAQKVAVPVTI